MSHLRLKLEVLYQRMVRMPPQGEDPKLDAIYQRRVLPRQLLAWKRKSQST